MSNRQSRLDEVVSEVKNGPRISNPIMSAVQFAHLTNTEGGASMNVHTNKIASPGEKMYFVGGEPDKDGNRIPTQYHGKTELDASGGYDRLSTAVGHMRDRNEKALWDMEKMDEVRNPHYRDDGRPASSPPDTSGSSDLSPQDVLRHKARLMGVGGRNPAMTLGSWRDEG